MSFTRKYGWLVGVVLLTVAARAEAPGFRWPAPQAWQRETIPFPLGFAPELKYQGVEELRFAPGYFDAKAETYWTYAFAWWLEGEPALDGKTLERDLTRYFAGLSNAVGGKKYRFDPRRFEAKLLEGKEMLRQGHTAGVYTGTVQTYDPFVTGKAITLNVNLQVWDCPRAKRRVLLAALSPKPTAGAAWKSLMERAAALECH